MASPFTRSLLGRSLCARYRLDGLVGKGGMGAVFRATDEVLERQVAIKVIAIESDDPAEEEYLRSRFKREARTAARVRSQHVVRLYDIGLDQEIGLDFIVMELLAGEDLGRRLRRDGPLPPPLALRVVSQAAKGLAKGHRLGLVHRDVKPANLFLEGEIGRKPARAVVLDFGIAKLVEDARETATHLTLFGRAPLSPGYAAPEQLRGSTGLTAACDVFALGVTAFESLTGTPPFDDAARARLAEGTPVPAPSLLDRVPGVPAGVDDVIRRAMAFDPADRFPNAGEFLQALRRAAADSVQVSAATAPAIAVTPTPPLAPTESASADSAPADPAPADPAPVPAASADPAPGASPRAVRRRPTTSQTAEPPNFLGVIAGLVGLGFYALVGIWLIDLGVTHGPELLARIRDEWNEHQQAARLPQTTRQGLPKSAVTRWHVAVGGRTGTRLPVYRAPEPARLIAWRGNEISFTGRDTVPHTIVVRDSVAGVPADTVRVRGNSPAVLRVWLAPGVYLFKCESHGWEPGGKLVVWRSLPSSRPGAAGYRR